MTEHKIAEGVTVSTEYSKLSVTFLPGGILKIGQTKYADEFFLAIDKPDPTKLYRMERKNDITTITIVEPGGEHAHI